MIEIEGPDGVIYEFPEGMAEAEILSAMEQVYGNQPQNTVSGVAGQFGAGSQEGIAQLLGFPVEAVTGAINGVGDLTGLWGPIESPVGGSASINAALAPFRSGIAEPQTDLERASRRIGEEVGATAAGLPLGLATSAGRAAPVATALVEGASGLGSGIGAAVANYFAPDSAIAEIAGQLLGGIPAAVGASRALGMGGTDAVRTGGTIESQKQRAADAYDLVRADKNAIGAQRATDLDLGLTDAAIRAGIDPDITPVMSGVNRGLHNRINPNMTIEDVEKLRRISGRAVPATASGEDIAAGMALKNEITDYLDRINSPTTEALREGRDATRRYKAAEAILEAETKAVRRAASTGSGGNEINAMRQNLRSILDNPNKRKSFTADELARIEQIVVGNTEQNLMRRLSRFAPSSGGLASMLGIGGTLASAPVALPIIGITEGAKALGERSTRSSIDSLVRSLLDERIVKPGTTGYSPIAEALLGARIAAEEPEEVMLDPIYLEGR